MENTDIDKIKDWWNNLSKEWQEIINEALIYNFPAYSGSGFCYMIGAELLDIDVKPIMYDHIVGLKKLYITNKEIKSLEPITILKEIEILDCYNNDLVSLDQIKSFKKLKYLNIGGIDVKKFNIANELTHLQVLVTSDKVFLNRSEIEKSFDIQLAAHHLHSWWKELDIEWQKTFCKIQTVLNSNYSVSFDQLDDIKPILSYKLLCDIDNLKEIDLRPFKDIRNISSLVALKNIKILNISDTKVDDIGVLGELTNLKILYINNLKIKSLRPLKELVNLEFLSCINTECEYNNLHQNLLDTIYKLKGLKILFTSKRKYFSELEIAKEFNCFDVKNHKLYEWWQNLPLIWKDILRLNYRAYQTGEDNEFSANGPALIGSKQLDIDIINEFFNILCQRSRIFLGVYKVNSLKPLEGLDNLTTLDLGVNNDLDSSELSYVRALETVIVDYKTLKGTKEEIIQAFERYKLER
ncbi:MAG TPA: leucine-rich repeat domain-containing protein [Bacteroidales bacterium]